MRKIAAGVFSVLLLTLTANPELSLARDVLDLPLFQRTPAASVASDLAGSDTTGAGSVVSDTAGFGYLTVKMGEHVDSLYVIVDQRYSSPHFIANGKTVALPAGERYLTVATKRTRDLSFSATVRADEADTVRVSLISEPSREEYLNRSSYPVLRSGGANLLVLTDRDSRVFVDDVPQGMGAAQLRVSPGRHFVRTVHAESGHTEREVFVQGDPPRLTRTEMHNKPSRAKIRLGSLVPGLGQLYKRQNVKGLALLGGFVVTAVGGAQQHLAFLDRNHEYETTRGLYQRVRSEEEALRLGNESEHLYGAARGAYRRRNVLLGLAAGAYLYSVFDAWLDRPEGGYRTPQAGNRRVEPLLGARAQGLRLVVPF